MMKTRTMIVIIQNMMVIIDCGQRSKIASNKQTIPLENLLTSGQNFNSLSWEIKDDKETKTSMRGMKSHMS